MILRPHLLKEADYQRKVFHITVEANTVLDDMLKPAGQQQPGMPGMPPGMGGPPHPPGPGGPPEPPEAPKPPGTIMPS